MSGYSQLIVYVGNRLAYMCVYVYVCMCLCVCVGGVGGSGGGGGRHCVVGGEVPFFYYFILIKDFNAYTQ